MSNNVNLDKLLKFDLGFNILGHIKKFPNYLDYFHKYVFAMIK